jgi:hypothetical protein
MGVAAPCNVFSISAGMHPSPEGISAFPTDYFSREGISLLVFYAATLDSFFGSSL